VVEVDEVYVTAGLKGRNNSRRIKRLGRRLRRRGLRRRGRGTWDQNKPAMFILLERGGGEDYAPSGDLEAETAKKVIGRRVSEGSTVYTDFFKAYLGLGDAGYRHEAVNHSAGEYARGDCHINSYENRAPCSGLAGPPPGHMQGQPNLYLAAFKACRQSRGMRPIEAFTGILKTALLFLAPLAILRSYFSPETTIPKGQPQNS